MIPITDIDRVQKSRIPHMDFEAKNYGVLRDRVTRLAVAVQITDVRPLPPERGC
jgi:primosomal protein N''